MKKLTLSLLFIPFLFLAIGLRAGIPVNVGIPANVNEYLLKTFAASYPAAEKISWSEENGHYVVHFFDHSVRTVIAYDAKANLLQSIRYYSDPSLLPVEIAREYHRRYPDKSLFGIIEVSDGEATAWFLKGQNEKHWTTVKAYSNGEMEVVEKIRKQS